MSGVGSSRSWGELTCSVLSESGRVSSMICRTTEMSIYCPRTIVYNQWPDLPQGIVSAPQGGPSGAMGSVDMVEGPEVNPIQGMHRSYDDVRRDLHRHQRNERKAALAAGSLAPIYVSEYIFFSTGSAGRIEVALGRVCTVPPIKNASKGVMIDVSAYTHTPPPPAKAGGTAVLGFFGS